MHKQKIVSQTTNGVVFKCDRCECYHIEFKNLNFNLSEEQLQYLFEYLSKLNGEQCEQQNRQLTFRRKIIVPIGHEYFNILLNASELQELKVLLNLQLPSCNNFFPIKSSSGLNFVAGLS